jgi:hypothetical protein
METNWKQLQPGYTWNRKITPEMTDSEGELIEIACKVIGEKGQKRIRRVRFNKEFCFSVLDRLFLNLSKEQAVILVTEWASDENRQNTPED